MVKKKQLVRSKEKENYFIVCESCGGLDFVDYESKENEDEDLQSYNTFNFINTLEKDGNVTQDNYMNRFLVQKKVEILICNQCEKECYPIFF